MKWIASRDDGAGCEIDAQARTLVEQTGVDVRLAGDVLSAVRAYCRSRHGTEQIPRDYFYFLLARAGTRLVEAVPAAPEPETVCRILEPVADDPMFVRALAHAGDAGELAEAYRRKLVGVAASDLVPGRYLLALSLHRISIDVHRDLPMAWSPVLHRAAGWVGSWRAGNPGLAIVKVIPHRPWFASWPEAREMLESAIRRDESARKLAPASLVFT